MYFVSARDWWLAAVLFLGMGIGVGSALLVFLIAGMLGFVVWIWWGTGYRVTADELQVRSGPFRWRVPLAAITAVRRTRNPLSSPALSLDRLEVRYGPGRVLLISPLDREGFLAVLRARCPAAVIDAA